MSKSASERKVLRSLNFLCAKTRKLKESAKSVLDECRKTSAALKAVRSDCAKIFNKISEKEKHWSVIGDIVTRVILASGLTACMIILSCNSKVGVLDNLSKKVDEACKMCDDISNCLYKIDTEICTADKRMKVLLSDGTNRLSSILIMMNSLSNKVEKTVEAKGECQ